MGILSGPMVFFILQENFSVVLQDSRSDALVFPVDSVSVSYCPSCEGDSVKSGGGKGVLINFKSEIKI
jgi:hypothetical protein